MTDWIEGTGGVIALDVETTGLSAETHAVWEVAIVTEDASYEWMLPIGPADLDAAEPEALAIGRFHERYRRDEVTPAGMFCDEFARLTAGRHLVGAVPSFDEERLRRLMQRHGVTPRWHHHLVCVENLAVGFLSARGVKVPVPWSSSWLTEQLGVAMPAGDERHTALGDARWARGMWRAVLDG